jgi:hypothetical protein
MKDIEIARCEKFSSETFHLQFDPFAGGTLPHGSSFCSANLQPRLTIEWATDRASVFQGKREKIEKP